MTPPRRRLVALVAAAAAGVGAALLTTGGSDPPVRVATLPEAGSGFRPSSNAEVATPGPGTTEDRRRQARADAALPVPLERAAARLFLVGFPGTTRAAPIFEALERREWGAVLVDRPNVVDTAQLRGLTRALERVPREARQQPPLVAVVQRGGVEVAVEGAGPPRQAETEQPAAARENAREAGRELRRLGFGVVMTPSADLSSAGGPWEGRGFSDDPDEAARLVDGAVAGWRDAHMVPVVGHFPGEGAASQDPEAGVATVGLSREELRARDGKPFAAVLPDTPTVQLSGALFAALDAVTPATLDPAVVRDLRARGFRGAIVSADLTATTVATGGTVAAAAVAALRAGCDVLFVPGDRTAQEQAHAAVVRAVRDGEVPVARVREALARGQALRQAAALR